MAAYQYIYTMKNVAKIYPGGREIMKNVTLAFLPGAKIGVLGINGAGKSTLLKIMAGLDQDIGGEARAANGVKVGYLSQEPQLDPDKDVLGNVMEGVGETKALLDRFNEVSMGFSDPDADMDALLAEQAELQEKIDACDGWDLRAHARDRDGRAALPARRCRRDHAVGRRAPPRRACAACCCRTRTCCCWTSPPTIWTPNRWPGWSGSWPSTRAPWWRSPTTATSWTMSRAGSSSSIAAAASPTRATTPAGWSRRRSGWPRRSARTSPGSARWSARPTGSGRAPRPAAPSPRPASRPMTTCWQQSRDRAPELGQIVIPPGPRLGDLVIEAEHLTKAFGDRLLIEDLELPAAARRHRRHHRPQRRRQDHAVPDDHGPGAAGQRQHPRRRHRQARLCRPEPRRAGAEQDGLRGDLGRRRA